MDERGPCLVRSQLREVDETHHLPRRPRERARECRARFLHDPPFQHRGSTRRDPLVQHVPGDVEPEDERRMPRVARPQLVAGRRRSGVRELQRAHNAAAIVRMDSRCGPGIERLEATVRVQRSVFVVKLLPELTDAR